MCLFVFCWFLIDREAFDAREKKKRDKMNVIFNHLLMVVLTFFHI